MAETILRDVQGAPEEEIADRIQIRGNQICVTCLNSIIGQQIFEKHFVLHGSGYGVSIGTDGSRLIEFPPRK